MVRIVLASDSSDPLFKRLFLLGPRRGLAAEHILNLLLAVKVGETCVRVPMHVHIKARGKLARGAAAVVHLSKHSPVHRDVGMIVAVNSRDVQSRVLSMKRKVAAGRGL